MIKNLLSIADSGPIGGAGNAADLKTFAAFGCNGITAFSTHRPNTQGVRAVHVPPANFAAMQIDAVFEDFEVSAVLRGGIQPARRARPSGVGPPWAKSRSSIVWSTGIDVPLAI